MTPLQFAREQCANFENGGSCAGIGIRDDGSLYMFGKKAACVLTNKERCRYFEECVLPMHFDTGSVKGAIRAEEHQEALRLYAESAPALARTSGRLCPECRQREVEPPKRFCYVCAKQRENRRARQAMQKRRSDVTKTPPENGSIS